jgi:hypothetical protein
MRYPAEAGRETPSFAPGNRFPPQKCEAQNSAAAEALSASMARESICGSNVSVESVTRLMKELAN